MRLIVKPHKIIIDKDKLVNEKEIDISKCTFEFDEEITDDFVKEALFTFKGTTYSQLINNNECAFPQEVLAEKGQVEIGVVAYKVENEVEIKRYNPSPAYFNTLLGSLKDDVENSEEITPTDKEQILSELANKQDTLVSGVNIKTINNETLLGEGNINITGGGGTSDYEDLDNKPSINNVELSGNKSLNDLGIQPAGSYALASDIPTNLSQLTDDTTHRLVTDTEKTTWNNKSNFSGSYNDLTNKPSIPTKTSDLTNDSGFVGSGELANYSTKNEVQELIDKNGDAKIYKLKIKSSLNSDFSSGQNITTQDTDDLTNMSNIITNGYEKGIIGIYLGNSKEDSYYYINLLSDISTKPNKLYFQGFIFPYANRTDGYHFLDCYVEVTGSWQGDIYNCTKIKFTPVIANSGRGHITTWGNTNQIVPTGDYNPATKKYVDDAIASAITTTLGGSY